MRFLFRVVVLLVIVAVAFGCGLLARSTNLLDAILGPVQTNVRVESVLEGIQELSQLTTTRYTFSNRITASRDLPALLAIAYGQELTMDAVGYVTAGVDLSQLTLNDVTTTNGVLQIVLPAPVLQDCFFNENLSQIVAQRSALFAQYPIDLQVAARRIAVERFRDAAIEEGILEAANTQAVNTVTIFLELATQGTYSEIRVAVRPVDPNATLPESCQ